MSSSCDTPRSNPDPGRGLPQPSPAKAGSSGFFWRPWRLNGAVVGVCLFLVVTAWVTWGGPRRWLQRWRVTAFPAVVTNQAVAVGGVGWGTGLMELAAKDQATLVPDDTGWIAEAVLNYTPDYEAQVGASYTDLLNKLSSTVRLQICCPSQDAVDQFVDRWGALALSGGRQVVLINLNRPLSLWPRDRWIARQTTDWRPARNFVPSPLSEYREDKQNDLLVPTLLWPTGLVPGNTLISFHLEGGNVLANRRHLFAGINVFSENRDRFLEEASLGRILEDLFGLTPVLLSDRQGTVPWAHADMYLTLLDEETVLVADPRAGLHLIDSLSASGSSVEGEEERLRWHGVQLNRDDGLLESFDDVAAQMTALGYTVGRLPALVAAELGWMVTYNNVLLEYHPGHKTVFLPVYRLAALDEVASEQYRQLGFEVRTVDVADVFELGGAVRCLVNVTRRFREETPAMMKSPAYLGGIQFFEVGTPPEAVLEGTR